ncbi:hypothetical protein BDR04DRAFT_1122892 [Suillus decipiens]|nr:hypothetical protein BDR04DRAFT_1122892 [Suillus decipiens]
MYYVNFNDNITAHYGVILDNWPLKKFANPGDISLMVEVKIMYNAFMMGAIKFCKLTTAEWEDWDQNRFNETFKCSSHDNVDEDRNTDANIDPFLLSISQPGNTKSHSVATTREAAPIQRKQGHEQVEGDVMHVISGITGMGGNKVAITKKPCKTHSDKGKKRELK